MPEKKIDGLEIRSMIDVNKKDWINIQTTNCYAYALGLDVPEKEIVPGAYGTLGAMAVANDHEITNFERHYIPGIERLEMDLDFLHLKYEDADPFELVKENEWLIAYYYCPYEPDFDFHFLRRTNEGVWTHKMGWKKGLFVSDDDNKLIINPEKAGFDFYIFEKCLKLSK